MVEADPLTRVRLDLSYDGTEFSGWAVQPDRRTVQGVVAAGAGDRLACAVGRADRRRTHRRRGARVRAGGALRSGRRPRTRSCVRRLAGMLPPDVRVRSVRVAPPGFDARFGAVWRRYEYRISDDPIGVAPLRRRFVVDHRRPLDVAAMHTSAQGVLGLHDFAAFCRRAEFGTTIRTVQRFAVTRDDAGEVVVSIQADAFCQAMVRSLVGALLDVGVARQPLDWPATLLDASQRSSRITVAPAHGLTLVEVGYPPDDELAARTEVTRARRDA